MITYEWTLWGIGMIWLIIATVFDTKTKEVPNWLNFTLLITALAFRTIYSIIEWNYWPIINGLIGLGAFIIIANIFYYAKLFGGGDAKLLISLGAVIGITPSITNNTIIMLAFITILLITGFFYGIIGSGALLMKNWKEKKEEIKKEFEKQTRKNKKIFLIFMILFLAVVIADFYYETPIIIPIVFITIITPILVVYAKTVENTIMIKKKKTEELREGDWLYKDVRIGREIIKSDFNGLTKKEIEKLIENKKQVRIKEGLAFVPAFLITYIMVIILWNPGWGFLNKLLELFL